MAKKVNRKLDDARKKVDTTKFYELEDAVKLVKEVSYAKFVASVNLVFNLNLDVRKAEQQLRGNVSLPHGNGKDVKVLVLTENNDLTKQAKDAKADLILGEQDFKEKIAKNEFDFDVLVTEPKMMQFLGKYGKKLGPKGLMPNPKLGTITTDVNKVVSELKKGKANYRTDKNGNVHTMIGKVSMSDKELLENAEIIIDTIRRLKPSSAKGKYIQNLTISATMSPSIKILLEV